MTEVLPTRVKRVYKRLRLREVSLVDEGCSPGTDAVVIKARKPLSPDDHESGEQGREVGREPGGTQASESELVEKALKPFVDLSGQLQASLISMEDFIEKGAAMATGLENEAQTGGDPVAKSAARTAASIVTENVMNAEQIAAALAAAEARLETMTTEITVAKSRADTAEAALAAANTELASVKETLAATEAEVAKARKPELTAEEQDAEVLKALPEHLRDVVLKARAQDAAAAKVLVDAEIDAEVTKARGLGLSDADALGKALHEVKTKAPDAYEAVNKALNGAAKIADASNSLFRTYGAVAENTADGEPADVLKSRAKELQAADESLTDEAAFAKAAEADPKLYNDYIAKRRIAATATASAH